MDGVGEGLFEAIFNTEAKSPLHQNVTCYQGISNLKPICNKAKGEKCYVHILSMNHSNVLFITLFHS